jgi:hypothetical protein
LNASVEAVGKGCRATCRHVQGLAPLKHQTPVLGRCGAVSAGKVCTSLYGGMVDKWQHVIQREAVILIVVSSGDASNE